MSRISLDVSACVPNMVEMAPTGLKTLFVRPQPAATYIAMSGTLATSSKFMRRLKRLRGSIAYATATPI